MNTEKQIEIEKENLRYEKCKQQAQVYFAETCATLQPLHFLGFLGRLLLGPRLQNAYAQASQKLHIDLFNIEQIHYERLLEIELKI